MPADPPEPRARIVAKLESSVVAGAAFQIDSLDTGWSSGRIALTKGAAVDVVLSKPGDNTFRVFVFDSDGHHGGGCPATLDFYTNRLGFCLSDSYWAGGADNGGCEPPHHFSVLDRSCYYRRPSSTFTCTRSRGPAARC